MIIKKTATSDVPHLKRLWKEAFGDTDEFIDGFFSLGFSPDRSLALYCEDEIASVIYWFDCEFKNKKVAYVYGVATRKCERGKGYSTLLMKRAHEILYEDGYVGVILVPADEGLFRFYERIGYLNCCLIDEKLHTASADTQSITKISAKEYLKLRNPLLPQDSIVFTNNNLHFLDFTAFFYKGNGFILATSSDNDTLKIIEFWGDEKLIPSITAALNHKSATTRTYGKSRPFAMYFSFDKNTSDLPNYLGFAFD